MTLRSLLLLPLVVLALAYAGDGVPPLGSAADYQAHQTVGNVTVAASTVTAFNAKQIFKEDLDKHGYLVFEVAFFPMNGSQTDVLASEFRLRQGSDPNTVRPVSPRDVAAAIYPQKSPKPELPSNVHVYTSETIGYETGPGAGRNPRQGGVYTDSNVGVGIGKDPRAPVPEPPPSPADLQQRLEDQSLPEGLTSRDVAGYVFFPKPSKDKRGNYTLMYFGKQGQGTLKLAPPAH
jgi:hypothetical protein